MDKTVLCDMLNCEAEKHGLEERSLEATEQLFSVKAISKPSNNNDNDDDDDDNKISLARRQPYARVVLRLVLRKTCRYTNCQV